jgi:hypothetical protein
MEDVIEELHDDEDDPEDDDGGSRNRRYNILPYSDAKRHGIDTDKANRMLEYKRFEKKLTKNYNELLRKGTTITKKVLAEHGIDTDRFTIKDLLFVCVKTLDKRNHLLKRNLELMKKKKKDDITDLSKDINGKLTLTREELATLGIELKSNVVGKYTKLSPATQEVVQKELAAAMIDKMAKIINSTINTPPPPIVILCGINSMK